MDVKGASPMELSQATPPQQQIMAAQAVTLVAMEVAATTTTRTMMFASSSVPIALVMVNQAQGLHLQLVSS